MQTPLPTDHAALPLNNALRLLQFLVHALFTLATARAVLLYGSNAVGMKLKNDAPDVSAFYSLHLSPPPPLCRMTPLLQTAGVQEAAGGCRPHYDHCHSSRSRYVQVH